MVLTFVLGNQIVLTFPLLEVIVQHVLKLRILLSYLLNESHPRRNAPGPAGWRGAPRPRAAHRSARRFASRRPRRPQRRRSSRGSTRPHAPGSTPRHLPTTVRFPRRTPRPSRPSRAGVWDLRGGVWRSDAQMLLKPTDIFGRTRSRPEDTVRALESHSLASVVWARWDATRGRERRRESIP